MRVTDGRGGAAHRHVLVAAVGLALVLGACTGDEAGTASDAPADTGGGAQAAAASIDSSSTTRRGVTVTGTGAASATPDVVVADLGVEVRSESVQAALTGANDAAEALVAALRDAGVADEAIRTTGVSVREERREPPERPVPEDARPSGEPGAIAFVATNRVTVELDDVETAGATIQQSLEAAGDAGRLDRLQLQVSDPSAAMEQAREAAFTAARDAAEQYASLAGRSLGELVAIDEAGGAAPRPVAGRAEDAAGGVPIQPGQQEVQVSVTANWSLGE